MMLKERFLDYSVIRWGSVGVTTFVIDYLIFIFLFEVIESVFLANLISASVATIINYYAHHSWTFKSDQQHSSSSLKYLLNLFFWWFVSTSIIQALVVSNIDPKIAKLAPLVLIIPINYFVLNKMVFKKKT